LQNAENPVEKPSFEMFVTGGEPLIVWDDLRRAFDFARHRLASLGGDVAYTPHVVTNGLLIDRGVATELKDSDTVVTVALDSPHNQVRIDADGNAATPRAIEGLRALIAVGHPRTSINVVIAGEQFDRIDDVLTYIEDQGALQGITTVQLSPLAPPIQHTQFAGKGLAARRSGFGEERTCLSFSEKLIEYSERFDLDMKDYGRKLAGWMLQGGTLYRCPVAEWTWCATPNGDVFACHQLVGVDRFRMGNLFEPNWYSGSRSKEVRQAFLDRTIFSADLCGDCALCSTCMVFVDCPARSFLECGDIGKIPPHYCSCGKAYLEKLLGEHLVALTDDGSPRNTPLGPNTSKRARSSVPSI
jgi:uncharacterized protein